MFKVSGFIVGIIVWFTRFMFQRISSRYYPSTGIASNSSLTLTKAYVGGLYTERGFDAVNFWLSDLLRPFAEEAYRIVRQEHSLVHEPIVDLDPGSSTTELDES